MGMVIPAQNDSAGTTHPNPAQTTTPETQSTVIYTSVVTASASGGGSEDAPVVVTVAAASGSDRTRPYVVTLATFGHTTLLTFQAAAATRSSGTATTSSIHSGQPSSTIPANGIATPSSSDNTTAIALGVGIPLGVVLVALFVAGGYLWGRSASRAARRSRRYDKIGEEDEAGAAAAAAAMKRRETERFELPPETCELPREVSSTRSLRRQAALPMSPVELPGNYGYDDFWCRPPGER